MSLGHKQPPVVCKRTTYVGRAARSTTGSLLCLSLSLSLVRATCSLSGACSLSRSPPTVHVNKPIWTRIRLLRRLRRRSLQMHGQSCAWLQEAAVWMQSARGWP